MSENFGPGYADAYDLLYRDKDYVGEAGYVVDTLQTIVPHARSILELGAGTGRHGRLIADAGFNVRGVELSAEMVAISAATAFDGAGAFTCEVGDIRRLSLGNTFDAVISLFHVMGYNTTNDDLLAAFRVVADHLNPGGVFIFDIWHGPAVLTEQPSARSKTVSDERRRVRRTAQPTIDLNKGTVNVHYEMTFENLETGAIETFVEDHLVRYLFPTEVDLLARQVGLQVLKTEEFLTGAAPSSSTWGLCYVLGKGET